MAPPPIPFIELDQMPSFTASVPLRKLKNPVCGQYLGHDHGSQGPCIILYCYFVYIYIYIYIYKNRRKFNNSKRLTRAFVLSGDIICFHRRGVRHNANFVAYVPM